MEGEPTLVVRSSRAGSIQALDVDGLVRWARKHESEVVLRQAVGDFVSHGATLIHVYGPATDARGLEGSIAIGAERTTEQDPAFALRIMVDVAIRALSPAVNDPTTAVQVIDYLGETLRQVGTAGFAVTTQVTRAPGGAGVVIRHRHWEDFLALGVTEIREYGSPSIQVMRRLRAMLEDLDEAVPPECRGAVASELARLDATVARVERVGRPRPRERGRPAGHRWPLAPTPRRGSDAARAARGRSGVRRGVVARVGPVRVEPRRAAVRLHGAIVLPTVVLEIVLGIMIGPEALGLADSNSTSTSSPTSGSRCSSSSPASR